MSDTVAVAVAEGPSDGKVRIRLATMMAWTLVLTVAAIAGMGYLAVNARETFNNWTLIEKILAALDHVATALGGGLLGYMSRDMSAR